jgi:hypothetical protein
MQLRDLAESQVEKAKILKSQRDEAIKNGHTENRQQYEALIRERQLKACQLEDKAAQIAFKGLNAYTEPEVINLHWLYVRQALPRLDARIISNSVRGIDVLRVDVGVGLHSDPAERLRPAVFAHCRNTWKLTPRQFPAGHWWRRFIEVDLRPYVTMSWMMRVCFLYDSSRERILSRVSSITATRRAFSEFVVRDPKLKPQVRPLAVQVDQSRFRSRRARLAVKEDVTYPKKLALPVSQLGHRFAHGKKRNSI